jgi:hypothetical protein
MRRLQTDYVRTNMKKIMPIYAHKLLKNVGRKIEEAAKGHSGLGGYKKINVKE